MTPEPHDKAIERLERQIEAKAGKPGVNVLIGDLRALKHMILTRGPHD